MQADISKKNECMQILPADRPASLEGLHPEQSCGASNIATSFLCYLAAAMQMLYCCPALFCLTGSWTCFLKTLFSVPALHKHLDWTEMNLDWTGMESGDLHLLSCCPP